MTEGEIQWLAGLLEGEGCFGAWGPIRGGRRLRAAVSLKMTDRDVVERAHALLGLETIVMTKGDSRGKGWSDTYVWQANGATAERIMRLVLPYMGERRTAKINEILAMDLSHRPKEAT